MQVEVFFFRGKTGEGFRVLLSYISEATRLEWEMVMRLTHPSL